MKLWRWLSWTLTCFAHRVPSTESQLATSGVRNKALGYHWRRGVEAWPLESGAESSLQAILTMYLGGIQEKRR